MKKKVLAILAVLCTIVFTSCSNLIVQLEKEETEPTYTITIAEDIEHGTVTADKEIAQAGEIITLTANAAENYYFASYTVKDTDGSVITVTDGKFTMPKSNVTVSAEFALTIYTVKFDTDGGTEVASQTVPSGQKATEPTEPTKTVDKTTYGFLGWYNGENKFSFDTTITADITLTAKWLEGFVKVTGTTFDGTKTLTPESKVFISGRNITIGSLYVCDHEVTQKEYSSYMVNYGEAVSNSNYKWTDTYGLGDNHPAYRVNWYEAVIYCNLRSMAEGLTPAYYLTIGGSNKTNPADWIGVTGSNIKKDASGKYYYNAIVNSSVLDYKGETDTDGGIQFDFTANGYRLPTEAEWEYIARGGSEFKEYTYSGSNTIDDVAWYRDNSYNKAVSSPDYGTHEVKTKAPNSLKIYDMSGNVWEWCWDWYGSISSSTGASGASSGNARVQRGGSWSISANSCGVAYRSSGSPDYRFHGNGGYGFRLVRSAQ